jgi:hypothetical protein
MALVLLLVIGVACGRETVGGSCDGDGDCKDGLFCAQGGSVKGTCTAECDENASYCSVRFGERASCSSSGYCVYSHQADDPCGGRCPPSTTKCENGTCVPK